MLTAHAAWKDAMSMTGADRRWMVEIAWTDSLSQRYVSGTSAVYSYPDTETYPPAVTRVSPIAAETDPFTRSPVGARIEIEFRPGYLDAIEINDDPEAQGVIGKRVKLWLGEAQLVEDYWLLLCTGLVIDTRVSSSGAVTLVVDDALSLVLRQTAAGSFVSRHPLYVLSKVAALLPSDVLDDASFDGDDHDAISHWSITHTPQPPTTEGQAYRLEDYDAAAQDVLAGAADSLLIPMGDYFSALLPLCDGVLRSDSAGALAYFRYVEPTTADRHLAAHEIGAPEIESVTENRANPVSARFAMAPPEWWDDDGNTNPPADPAMHVAQGYTPGHVSGPASQDWGSIDASEPRELTMDWVTAAAVQPDVTAALTGIDASQTYVLLEDASYVGFCGGRWRNGFRWGSYSALSVAAGVLTVTTVSLGTGSADFTVGDEISWWDGSATQYATITVYGGSNITATTSAADHTGPGGDLGYVYLAQAEEDRISGSRKVYIRCGHERMEVTAVRPSRTVSGSTYDCQMGIYPSYSVTAPKALRMTIVRGDGPTAGSSHDEDQIFYDTTIPKFAADPRAARFACGAPRVRLTAHLIHADLQPGDIVSFDHSALFSRAIRNVAGVDEDVLWEVTQVEVSLEDACVNLVLVLAAVP